MSEGDQDCPVNDPDERGPFRSDLRTDDFTSHDKYDTTPEDDDE